MSGIAQVHQPACAAYQGLYDIYRQLCPGLRDTFAQLQGVVKAAPAPPV